MLLGCLIKGLQLYGRLDGKECPGRHGCRFYKLCANGYDKLDDAFHRMDQEHNFCLPDFQLHLLVCISLLVGLFMSLWSSLSVLLDHIPACNPTGPWICCSFLVSSSSDILLCLFCPICVCVFLPRSFFSAHPSDFFLTTRAFSYLIYLLILLSRFLEGYL